MSNEINRNLPPPAPSYVEKRPAQDPFERLNSWLYDRGEIDGQSHSEVIKAFCYGLLPGIIQDSVTIGLTAITDKYGGHHIRLHLPVKGMWIGSEDPAEKVQNKKAVDASRQFDSAVLESEINPDLDVQLLFHRLDDEQPHESQLEAVLDNYVPPEDPGDWFSVDDWGENLGVITIPYSKV